MSGYEPRNCLRCDTQVMRDLDGDWIHVIEPSGPRHPAAPTRTEGILCSTLCDPDCGQVCHEVHLVNYKRDHDPTTCPAWLAYRAAHPDLLDRLRVANALVTFLLQFTDKLDSFEIWGGTERPPHVITLGELRAIARRL